MGGVITCGWEKAALGPSTFACGDEPLDNQIRKRSNSLLHRYANSLVLEEKVGQLCEGRLTRRKWLGWCEKKTCAIKVKEKVGRRRNNFFPFVGGASQAPSCLVSSCNHWVAPSLHILGSVVQRIFWRRTAILHWGTHSIGHRAFHRWGASRQ